MKKTILALPILFAVIAYSVFAAEDGGKPEGDDGIHAGQYVGSAEFERLKTLVGRWESEMQMPGAGGSEGGKGTTIKVATEYRMAANGTVIVERNFPDTPKEMISVYHDRGGKLWMTHYCAKGNQPQMSLTKATDGVIALELVEGSLDSPDESHMHAVSIAFDGADAMSQTWTMYEGGKETMAHTMTYRRVR
ncbi:MAG: hypothetical protein OXU79_15565 [Gemmatimonadota bacterium]|nr:hypothetical protein [Gemmatimonadota bacterium]